MHVGRRSLRFAEFIKRRIEFASRSHLQIREDFIVRQQTSNIPSRRDVKGYIGALTITRDVFSEWLTSWHGAAHNHCEERQRDLMWDCRVQHTCEGVLHMSWLDLWRFATWYLSAEKRAVWLEQNLFSEYKCKQATDVILIQSTPCIIGPPAPSQRTQR